MDAVNELNGEIYINHYSFVSFSEPMRLCDFPSLLFLE